MRHRQRPLPHGLRLRPLLAAWLAAPLSLPAQAQTLPAPTLPVLDAASPRLVGVDAAAVTTQGAVMTVTPTRARSVAEWRSFDVGADARVVFRQTDPAATPVWSVLNRVTGGTPSTLAGRLATEGGHGTVFLLNPAGIVFKPGAQLDVGALVASTLSLDDDAFLAGGPLTLTSAAPPAAGSAGAGGAWLQQQGTVNAAGPVVLAAPQVVQSGRITAGPGSTVALVAGRELTLDLGGPVAVRVTLPADGARVQITGTSRIAAPGGTVLLDARAAGAALDRVLDVAGAVSASRISLGADGSLALAGALEGELTARATGRIDQPPGEALHLSGPATLSAAQGIALTEPGNRLDGPLAVDSAVGAVALRAEGDLVLAALAQGPAQPVSVTAGGALTLPDAPIDTGLAALSLRSDGGALASSGALSGGRVSLHGRDGLLLGHDLTASGALSLTSRDAPIVQAAGRVSATGAASVLAGMGDVSLARPGNRFSGGLVLTARDAVVRADDALSLSGVLGRELRVSAGALHLGALQGEGDATLQAAGAITQSGALAVAGGTQLAASTRIALDDAGNRFGAPVAVNAPALRLRAAGSLTLAGSAVAGDAEVSAGGDLLQSGPLQVVGTARLASATGRVALADPRNAFGAPLEVHAAAGASLAAAGDLSVAALSAGVDRPVRLAAGGTLALPASGLDTGSAGLWLQAGAGVLAPAGRLQGGELSLAAPQGVVLAQDLSAAGPLTLSAPQGAVTQAAGRVSVAGATSVLAGRDVSLAQPGNRFGGGLSVSTAGGVRLAADGDLLLASLVAGRDRAVEARAGGTLVLPEHALDTGGAPLSLRSDGGALATRSALSGTDLVLAGRDGIVLAHPVTASASLALASIDAPIVQTAGRLDVTGTTSVAAGAGELSLAQPGNRFGDGLVLRARDAAVRADGALALSGTVARDLQARAGTLRLGTLQVDGDAGLDAVDAITQAGALAVAGRARFAAGTQVVLDDPGNRFGAPVAVTAPSLRLQAAGALTLAASAIAGDAQVAASGDLLQSGPLQVAGAARLASASGRVALADPRNAFGGPVEVEAAAGVSLAAQGDLRVAALAAGADWPVSLAAGGTLLLPEHALDTGGAPLSLRSDGGPLATYAALKGGSVSLHGRDGLQLGHDVTAAGPLSLSTADAPIHQVAGRVDVAGATSVVAGAGGVSLVQPGNRFGTGVALAARDAEVQAGGALALSGAVGHDLLARADAIELGPLQVGGEATLQAAGAITQSGALALTGATRLLAGTQVALLDAGNAFGGTVQATAQRLALRAGGDLVLGATHTAGEAEIAAGGSLLQAAPLDIGGPARFTVAGGLVLADARNRFHGPMAVEAGAGMRLTTAGDLVLQALVAGRDRPVDVVAGGRLVLPAQELDTGQAPLSLHADTGMLAPPAPLRGGDVTLSAREGLVLAHDVDAAARLSLLAQDAPITQTAGRLSAAAAWVVAGSGDVALAQPGNRFNAGVTLASARDAALRAADALAVDGQVAHDLSLGAARVVLGPLQVGRNLTVAAGDGLQAAGALTVGGAARFATAGAARLEAEGSRFGGPVVLDVGGDAALQATGRVALAGRVGGDLSLRAGQAVVGPLQVGRSLALDAEAGIAQDGPVAVAGATQLRSASRVTLDDAANTLTGPVSAEAGNLRLRAGGTLVLGPTTLLGDADVAAAGALSQAGPLAVAGPARLAAMAGALVLDDARNRFDGGVAAQAATALQLRSAGALALDGLSAGAELRVAAQGPVLVRGALSGQDVALAAGGSLTLAQDVTARGALRLSTVDATLSQSAGRLDVAGVTTLAAGSGDVRLAQPGNHLGGGVVVASARDLILRGDGPLPVAGTVGRDLDASGGDVVLGPLTVGGTAQVQAGGRLSQAGALALAGGARLTAGGDLVLTDPANAFIGPVTLQVAGQAALHGGPPLSVAGAVGGDAVLSADAGVTLGPLRVGGGLSIDAAGPLTQDGALAVAGPTRLSPAGDLALQHPDNRFGGAMMLDVGRDADLAAAGGLTLGGQVNGSLRVAAQGPLWLDALAVGGRAALRSEADIAQRGALRLAGPVAIDAAGGVDLGHAGNDFAGPVAVAGARVRLADANDLTLATLATPGAAQLAAGGTARLGRVSAATLDLRAAAVAGTGEDWQPGVLTLVATGAGIGLRPVGAGLAQSIRLGEVGQGTLALPAGQSAYFLVPSLQAWQRTRLDVAASQRRDVWGCVAGMGTVRCMNLDHAVTVFANATVAALLAGATAEELQRTWRTDNVLQQIRRGTHGRIGVSPPGIDEIRIDE